jgi:hypothetical protein
MYKYVFPHLIKKKIGYIRGKAKEKTIKDLLPNKLYTPSIFREWYNHIPAWNRDIHQRWVRDSTLFANTSAHALPEAYV